jgi:benzodiazapine receptor
MKDLVRQIIVILTVAATIMVNILANALPINGLNTGEISGRFLVYFVPAGYVFSIWGLIYIGLIAYAVFQAFPSQRENPRLRKTGYLAALGGLANIAWIFLWHYEQFPLTLIAMCTLLVSLIAIYLRLGIGKTIVPTAETWTVQIPFSVYLGWITVATVANITDVLYFLNWDGFGISPKVWFLLVLAAVIVISGLISLTRRDIAYNLVILWALVGIAVKHSSVTLIMVTSLVASVIVAAILLYSRFKPQAAIT